MKSLCITLLFVLLSINNYSQIATVEDPNFVNGIKSEDLKGNVKKIVVTDYKVVEKFGEATDFQNEVTEITFNEDGFYLSKNVDCSTDVRLGDTNCERKREFYLYNEGSNCVSYYSCNQQKFDSYEYNSECINGLTHKITYKYKTNYDKNGDNRVFYYDGKNNLTKIEFYSNKGNIYKIWQYSYNNKNKIIEMKEFNGDGNLGLKIVYGYDTKSRLILEDTYRFMIKRNPPQKDNSKNYQYDEHDNLVSCSTFAYSYYTKKMESNGFMINRYKYDIKGNIIEKIHLFGNSVDSSIKYYGYDSEGNWTKSVWYSNKNIPEKKVIRQIEYY